MSASGEERSDVFKYLTKEGSSVPSGGVSHVLFVWERVLFTLHWVRQLCRSHMSYYSFLHRRRFVPPARKVEKVTAVVSRGQRRGWALALLQCFPHGSYFYAMQEKRWLYKYSLTEKLGCQYCIKIRTRLG